MSEQQSGGSARHVVRICGVPRGDGLCVIFAGPVIGLLTHWHQGRSQGCPGLSKCPATIHRGRTVWKGYAPVRVWSAQVNKWLPNVLEVTECLEEQLRGRQLIGEMWHLVRAANSRKSAQVSGIYYATREEPGLKQPFDVRPVVQRLYHSVELEFGVANPLPSKLVVADVECEGPQIGEPETPRLAAMPTEAQREALRKLTGRLGSTFRQQRATQAPPSSNGHATTGGQTP